jgi:hypothetical protein
VLFRQATVRRKHIHKADTDNVSIKTGAWQFPRLLPGRASGAYILASSIATVTSPRRRTAG